MKRLFLSFLVFTSIVFSKNQNDVYQAQIDLSSLFQNKSKKLVNTFICQNIPSVIDNYSYVVQNMTKEERICHQQYRMSLQQKRYLLSHSYKEIVNRLLACKYLFDEQIWSLWQEYKNKRYWDWNNEKNYTENDLKDGLEKRKKDRQKQEQADEKRRADEQQRIEHQKLLQKYDLKILQNFDYVSSYQNHRQQALQQTINDSGKKHIKTHDVDVQTKAFMQTQGIDHRQFESLSGTIFSHQLFQECAEHYKKAAKIVYGYGLKNSVIIPHLLEFTKAAFVGTQYEQFTLAVQLSDIAEILSEISVGACKGLIKYGANLIDVVRDPKQIVTAAKHLAESLAKILHTLGGALVSYDQEGAVGVTNLQACQTSFGNDMILFNQICDVSKAHFNQWYEKSSLQDKAQAISEIVTDCVITPIIISKAMKACGGILFQAKEAVNFARAIELAEELGLGFMEAEELLLATEVGVQKLPVNAIELETAVTSLIESDVGIVKNSGWFSDVYTVQSFVENVQNIRLQNAFYKNNLLQKESIKYFEQYSYTQKLFEFYKDIEKTHGVMMVEYEGLQVAMDCKPKHIISPELDFKTSNKYQTSIGIIGGSHADISIQELQKNRFIKIVWQEELPGGCKALKAEHIFGDEVLRKTVWPPEWTAQQIMEAIKEAWHNQIGLIPIGSDTLHILGQTKSGITVEMFVKKMGNEANRKLKLKTAYPYFQEFSGFYK